MHKSDREKIEKRQQEIISREIELEKENKKIHAFVEETKVMLQKAKKDLAPPHGSWIEPRMMCGKLKLKLPLYVSNPTNNRVQQDLVKEKPLH